ncbi:MAG: tRNA (adenosine(37)-N6)-threonylcarbamoyltransferase complex ATPase subunit type 1 TsaE [Bacteroidia bacterium]|nr:tRNA (adenosine(37)-N6)-threonylcarbamoyltransferase complex ATPase subunit type 1 TsaE [Bacteroidia bacterium]
MQYLKLDISEISQHPIAAKELVAFAGNCKMFLFDAPMGAGKTTFIKSLCQFLDVTDTMSSPTYSIVNEYNTKSDVKIYHFDLYRLKSSEELFEIGFEDYVYSTNYIFIEWPELALPFLDSYLRIIIQIENNKRYLCAEIIKSS